MNWTDRIVPASDTYGGRARLKRTRISVEFMLGRETAGWTKEYFLPTH